MNENHCRIGKVRYKAHPYLVEIRPAPRGQGMGATSQRFLKEIIDQHPKGIAGFAIVAWGFDGSFSRGIKLNEDSPVGITMLPSYVSDVLRRETMKDVFHDMMTNG